jgi:MoxR-like ATPase
MDYPPREAEAQVLARYGGMASASGATLAQVSVLPRSLLTSAREEAERVHVAEALSAYVLDLARASREHNRLTLGLSTRGALALLKAARVSAGLRGGEFVTPDDVKQVAPAVMAHRLVLTPEAALEGAADLDVVRALLAETPVPR